MKPTAPDGAAIEKIVLDARDRNEDDAAAIARRASDMIDRSRNNGGRWRTTAAPRHRGVGASGRVIRIVTFFKHQPPVPPDWSASSDPQVTGCALSS